MRVPNVFQSHEQMYISNINKKNSVDGDSDGNNNNININNSNNNHQIELTTEPHACANISQNIHTHKQHAVIHSTVSNKCRLFAYNAMQIAFWLSKKCHAFFSG